MKPGAYVEASTDAWFEALDTFTSPQVSSPAVSCGGQSQSTGGCACGGGSDDSSTSASGGPNNTYPGVNVVHQGTVGPYETVTLQSTDPLALQSWLADHGYTIPDGIEPVIEAYVNEGFDFLALRLQPGQGVQQMTPVRVVTPGGDYELPLRMVAAGVGSFVNIKLFVIGEGRFAMPDLPEVHVDTSNLVWDFAQNSSNYTQLRAQALNENGGRTYITTFARLGAFAYPTSSPTGGQATFYVNRPSGGALAETRLSDLYFAQAALNDSIGVACDQAVAQVASSKLVVECEPGGTCPTLDAIQNRLLGIRVPGPLGSRCRVHRNAPEQGVDEPTRASPTGHGPRRRLRPRFGGVPRGTLQHLPNHEEHQLAVWRSVVHGLGHPGTRLLLRIRRLVLAPQAHSTIVMRWSLTLAWLLVSAPALAESNTSGHRHDGLFIRAESGMGSFVASSSTAQSSRRHFTGTTWSGAFAFGGATGTGCAFGGEFSFDKVYGLGAWDEQSGPVDVTKVHFFHWSFGPFLDCYPDRDGGLHVFGLVGLARLSVRKDGELSQGADKSPDPTGVSLQFGLGYDAWIARATSLGIAFRLSYSPLTAQEFGLDAKVKVFIPALVFTLTWD